MFPRTPATSPVRQEDGGPAVVNGEVNGRAAGNGRGRSTVALPAIQKLRGRENYATWAFAMRMILIREGTWAAVDAEDMAVNDQALATICLSLEEYNFSLVQDAKKAKEAWTKLRDAFQDSGMNRRIGLLRQFTSVRLVNCSSVESYVDQIMSASHKLKGIGFKVDDTWLASILLMGLPERYESMVMGLEASGMALSADAVKAKILQDVNTEKGACSSSTDGALYSKMIRKKPSASKDGKEEKLCYTCGKPGHFAAKCPERKSSKVSKQKGLCSIFAIGDVRTDGWYFDSGASSHMARSDQPFVDAVILDHDVGTANNGSMKVVAKGTVPVDTKEGRIDVGNVLKIPDLATNLLSVSTICKKGKKVIFTANKCEVWDEDGELVVTGTEEGGLYRVDLPEKAFLVDGIELWHRRLGHLNEGSLKKLKQMAIGIEFQNKSLGDCVSCLEGKQARFSFPSSGSRAQDLLELVHSDLCGPIEVPSLGGSRFFVTFVDDASKKVVVYFLEKKSQVLEAFTKFKAKAERQSGKKLKVLRTDNGTEYVNQGFREVLEREGIRHQTTCPYTPEQNGIAERMNRTLVEKARCMLNDAKLGKEFWAEAISSAAYLVNRCPTRSLDSKTPEEAWSGVKPNLKHLKVFGSSVMTHVPKVKRKKLDPKARRGIFVGYCDDTKGYRIYNPETGEFRISRDVVFLAEGQAATSVTSDRRAGLVEFVEIYSEDELAGDEEAGRAPGPAADVARAVEQQVEAVANPVAGDDGAVAGGSGKADRALPPQLDRPAEEQQGLRRSGRERIIPGKYSDYITFGTFSGESVSPQLPPEPINEEHELDDPTTYEEVLRRPDKEFWIRAMNEELQSLAENGTWVLADLPEGRKAIRNKWVFKTKRGPDGSIQRYKARLVVKGCSQRPGLDYDEVYSPVVRYATIRYLMALAVKYDLDIDQMDAVTAFLQGELNDEEIYMDQPVGQKHQNGKVCRLKKALYGLKQSSRVWNAQLDGVLQRFGLRRSAVDTCLYWMTSGEKLMFVTIYVDDFLIFTNDRVLKKKLKAYLCKQFKMKDLGEAKFCLGIRITRKRAEGKLWLDQQAYVKEIIQRFGMAEANPMSTPADPSIRLDKSMGPKNQKEEDEMKKVPFKEAVGCLSFAAQVTRPDISFAVNAVSQFSSNPGRQHWEAVKRIIRYLKGTSTKKLEYCKQGSSELVGNSDADWGGDPDNRRSTTGYVFTMQGGAISWNVKKQPTVALSSCEAEYMALSRAIQEAMWWNNLRSQIFTEQPVPINCDNQSAISIAGNGAYNPRTKHVSIRYHFVHNSLRDGVVQLKYIPTIDQPADGFTKPLAVQKQQRFCQLLGVSD